MRFDGDSTQILKYYIPSDVEGALTESIEIAIIPEDRYVPIYAHLSLYSNFYLIEEKFSFISSLPSIPMLENIIIFDIRLLFVSIL